MRRELAVLVCAAGCVCLAGCRSQRTVDNSTTFNTTVHPAGTGTTGSSASPYTEGKPQYTAPTDTGVTGSSGSPNTYYPDGTYKTYPDNTYHTNPDTHPGMVKDKGGCYGDNK
jgi:hypothetical protein